MAIVTAPVADFNGEVVGVVFKDGVATTTNRVALNYFRTSGYTVDGAGPSAEPEPADPRFIEEETVGTKLRDAAVDPRPEDFLPPTNAGEANPHGPEVVSPEIHGSQGTRPVTEGHVSDEPAIQEAVEQADVAEATEVATSTDRPPKSAGKADWVAYAVSQGTDATEAEAATKADLIRDHGGET